MTCHTTHHACDCVLKRMAKLEEVAAEVRALLEFQVNSEGGLTPKFLAVNKAIQELERE